MADDNTDVLMQLAAGYAKDRDADILLYIGGINMSSARNLVDLVCPRRKRKNLVFILGTNGGDAHAGYKISRCLQHAYEGGDYTIAVFGDCKSAGTLIAIGAKSIVLGQHGELGPLDVQLHKEDQLFAQSSGLTPNQALERLREEALSEFEHFMLSVHARSGHQISTRLAASIGIRMVVGLLGPIYEQIDPMRIGETQRALEIARAYGQRLDMSKNLKHGALDKLIEGYPSHDFAIDFDEAKGLFNRLKQADEVQTQIGEKLAHLLLQYKAISQDEALTLFITPELPVEVADEKPDANNSSAPNPVANPAAKVARRPSKRKSVSGSTVRRGKKPTANDRNSVARTAIGTSENGKTAIKADAGNGVGT